MFNVLVLGVESGLRLALAEKGGAQKHAAINADLT
jgi:hypothetical protein